MQLRSLFSWLPALALAGAAAAAEPVDLVRPFAGTSNSRWMLFPGPTLPMGMVKLSPDNQEQHWNGGYEYTVASISGFSFLHTYAMRSFAVLPTTGALQHDPSSSRLHPGSADGPFGGMWTAGWRSRIDKASEQAAPGYYAVDLLDSRVKAELTATERTGLLRFTYPRTDQAHIVIDFDPPAEEAIQTKKVRFKQVAPNRFEGEMEQWGYYASAYRLYFVLETSRPVGQVLGFVNGAPRSGDTTYGTAWRRPAELKPVQQVFEAGAASGVILNFATGEDEQVLLRAALSFVSLDNARLNLATEAAPAGWDFERVRQAARAAWADKLALIDVAQDDPERAAVFYTNLYRVYAAKGMMDDVNGQYTDYQGRTAQLKAPADHVYTSDSAWGWQWTQGPMWSTFDPKVAASVSNGLLALAERGGFIPQAPVNLSYASVMGAQHQNALIVASVQKGVPGVDGARAYAQIRHDLTTPGVTLDERQTMGNSELASYLKHGYVADEDGPQSSTFEYAYDDWCAGQLAQKLGKKADARMFLARAGYWKNAFDPAVASARRRKADGSWVAPFDPHAYGASGGWHGAGFMEGNAETYTFFVPHDIPGLAALVGREAFNRRLDHLLATDLVDMSNEPSLAMPFLFNLTGRPDLTQRHVRRVRLRDYDTSPYRGWVGEEDEGQLSAWYVMASLGLFQVDGGCAAQPTYQLVAPLYRSARFAVQSQQHGKRTVRIEAEGPARAMHIASVDWNGRPLKDLNLPHAWLAEGGTLHFVLSERPGPGE